MESARRMEAERGGILTKSSGTKQASGKPNRGGVSQVSPMVLRFGADSSSGRREINSNKYQTNNPIGIADADFFVFKPQKKINDMSLVEKELTRELEHYQGKEFLDEINEVRQITELKEILNEIEPELFAKPINCLFVLRKRKEPKKESLKSKKLKLTFFKKCETKGKASKP